MAFKELHFAGYHGTSTDNTGAAAESAPLTYGSQFIQNQTFFSQLLTIKKYWIIVVIIVITYGIK
jgi:hypothetical protein